MITKEEVFEFLISQGFKLVDQMKSEADFGNFYKTYSNGIVQFRLLKDRSAEFIDVSTAKVEAWYDLAIVKNYLYGEVDLAKPTPFTVIGAFLKAELNEVIELFSPKNYIKTKQALDELLIRRGRQLFPGQF